MFFARNIARCGSTSRTTYLDQLEFAETVGYDGLGVNEHHANAYELNPSPCLMAAALARHNLRGPGRARQLDCAPRPANSRRRGICDARRDVGGPAGRRLFGWHLNGHELCLWPRAGDPARVLRRGHTRSSEAPGRRRSRLSSMDSDRPSLVRPL